MRLFQPSLQNLKEMNKVSLLLIGLVVLASCNSKTDSPQPEPEVEQVEIVPEVKLTLEQISDSVLHALKAKDMNKLFHYSLANSIRFSPYATVSKDDNKIYIDGVDPNAVMNWGTFDGSGEPIELSFYDYIDRFVTNVDYADPSIAKKSLNKMLGAGNSMNNLETFYEGKEYVEYYNDGINPEYDGMDWSALRLVFDKMGENYRLIGVVHDQWTS